MPANERKQDLSGTSSNRGSQNLSIDSIYIEHDELHYDDTKTPYIKRVKVPLTSEAKRQIQAIVDAENKAARINELDDFIKKWVDDLPLNVKLDTINRLAYLKLQTTEGKHD